MGVRKYEGGGESLERTNNDEHQMHVSLKDLYVGATRNLTRSRRVICRSCRLHPELQRCRRCSPCPGEVQMRQRWMNQMQYTMERVEIPSKEKCTTITAPTAVTIERGMLPGDRVQYANMGSQLPKHIPGDLLVNVIGQKEAPVRVVGTSSQTVFKRMGNDLAVTLRVSLFEALLGFERTLKHLDDHTVRIAVPRGSVLGPGAGLEIEEEGMPLREDPASFGKLLVRFEIDFPKTIPKEAVSGLEAALRAVGQGPLAGSMADSGRRQEL